jgi:hypothetical protein
MPVLRIEVADASWPVVVAALESAAGPIPPGADVRKWAEAVTAGWFRAEIEGLIEPPPPPKSPRLIRPSRIRT